MGCYGCGKNTRHKPAMDLERQAKFMNNRQIRARLEVYKRENCQDCDKKEKCDYEMYVNCKKRKGIK